MKEEVIVIGSGIGGLSCALLLAHSGHKVTVLEKNAFIGGACSSYTKRGYTFDRTVHIFAKGMNGVFGEVLKRVGAPPIPFVKNLNRQTAFKIYHGRDMYYPVNANPSSWLQALLTMGKRERKRSSSPYQKPRGRKITLKSVASQLKLGKEFVRLVSNLLTLSEKDLEKLYEEGTRVTEYLCGFTMDRTIHALFMFLLGGMFGISPMRASAAEFIHCLRDQMLTNPEWIQYPIGGAQTIPNAFARALKSFGGEIRLNSPVKAIVIKGESVQGVRVGNELVKAPLVVSNADIQTTVLRLVGSDYFDKAYLDKIRGLQASRATMTFKIALKKKLIKKWQIVNLLHTNFLDWKEKYGQNAPRSNGFFGSVISNNDPNLAPPGHQAVIFCTTTPTKIPDKKLWKRVYYEDIMEFYPKMEKEIDFLDTTFPSDNTKATGKPSGAVIGLAQIPSQVGKNKPSSILPLKGLYVVGDTAGRDSRGIGTQLACESGMRCADKILKNAEKKEGK